MLEGLRSLGFNVPTLLAQVVTFIILLVVLRFVAYKPVMRMLDERSKKAKDSLEQAEYIKEQAANAEVESKKRIDAAAKEGQDMISKAARTADEVRQQGEQKAQAEAESLLNRARTEIQRERDDAIGEIRREFADLTIMAAEKVIERSLDKKAHQDLIDKVLEQAPPLKKG
jgi:F-type H+-transporting ATPase subunit b